jgi:dipeptidyl aminopeptidase/acylaminoacyl peptidase
MRTSLRILACLAAALAVAPHARVRANDVGAWTPDFAFKVKRVSQVRPSPDGRHVAYVVGTAAMEGEKSEWISQIWVADADGRKAVQLTRGDKSSTAPAWSPDSQWIAFVSARATDKDAKDAKANLWRIRIDGGEAEALTDEKGGAATPRWSPDGRRIALLLTDARSDDEEKADKEKRDARVVGEDVKRVRLAIVAVEKDGDGKRPVRRLTTGEPSVGNVEGPGHFDWSPDGKWIAFDHQPTALIDDWTKGDISLVEVESGAVTPLATTPAAESNPSFSPDGRWVAYEASDVPVRWGGASRIQVVPVAGGAPRALAATFDERPDLLGWTADGTRVIVSETRGTVGRLAALPRDGGAATDITPADTTVDTASLNASRTRIGFTSQAPDRAPEAFVADLPVGRIDATIRTAAKDRRRANGTAAAWTPVQVSHAQDLHPVALGRTEVVSWTAPDGKTIEGLLTYPVAYRAGTRVPLVVMVHGGPTGVFVRSYTGAPSPYSVAGFATHGFAVLRCNVRGSGGYGREFRYANYQDWGGGDYKDILSGVDALVAKGVADPDRLGIMGWSYGGYMTSWVITQTRRFKAASVGAGVTNLMSFTGTADIPSFIPDYFGGEYWDAFDTWRARSAMFNVKGVTTPTLIQHGESDRRVPISQGYELYNALKRQGVTTKMVVYPRQPHGIQEPKLMLDAMTRNLQWFDLYVLGRNASARN